MNDESSAGPGRRRVRRSREERHRIVAETFEPGASVAEVARRHGVNTNLVFKWRLRYPVEPTPVRLVPAVVEPAPLPVARAEPVMAQSTGRIEIVAPNGRRLFVDAGVDAAALARVLDVLERR